jgi:hypothetical protein
VEALTFRADKSKESVRKVAAQEIGNLRQLQSLYGRRQQNDDAVLRIFHVQNAGWALPFLLRKFNVEDRHDLVGRDFAKFIRQKSPEWRGKRPLLTGRTWKVQRDPWRGVSKAAFAFDYLKYHRVSTLKDHRALEDARKMMELNWYDDEGTSVILHVP